MSDDIDIEQSVPMPPPKPTTGRPRKTVNRNFQKPNPHAMIHMEQELFDVLQREAIKQKISYNYFIDRALRAYFAAQNIPVPPPGDRLSLTDSPYYTGPAAQPKPSAYAKEFPAAKTEHKMIWVPKGDWTRLMAWAQKHGLSNSAACCNAIACLLHKMKVPRDAKPDPNLPTGTKRFEYRKWKTDHTPKYIKNGTPKTAGRPQTNGKWVKMVTGRGRPAKHPQPQADNQ